MPRQLLRSRGWTALAVTASSLLLAACSFLGNPQAAPGTTDPGPASGALNSPSPAGRVYAANEGSNSLSVIDVATNKVLATIKTGESPHHLALTPDGKQLWLTINKANS